MVGSDYSLADLGRNWNLYQWPSLKTKIGQQMDWWLQSAIVAQPR